MEDWQFNALNDYRLEHGKKWKDRLTLAWMQDYREQWGVLRSVRNSNDFDSMQGIFEAFEQEKKRRGIV